MYPANDQATSSVSMLSIRPHPKDAPQTDRNATPRHLSSHLHSHKVNKDLHLRGTPLIARSEVVDERYLQALPTKLSATV